MPPSPAPWTPRFSGRKTYLTSVPLVGETSNISLPFMCLQIPKNHSLGEMLAFFNETRLCLNLLNTNSYNHLLFFDRNLGSNKLILLYTSLSSFPNKFERAKFLKKTTIFQKVNLAMKSSKTLLFFI